MVPQLDNSALSSFKLYVENKVLTKGLAYQHASGYFYPVQNIFNNYYAYAAPYQPLVADSSIPGATVMTGVYLDGVFITTGQSGLQAIDYEHAIVYFNSGISAGRISGNYSFADYNVKLTAESDMTVLFYDKYNLKPRISQTLSGIQPNETTYPIIFVRNNGSDNQPFAFGGLNTTTVNIRVITIADSAYLLDATNSILRDLKDTFVPLLSGSEFPFNALGGLKSGYNYTGIAGTKIPHQAAYIKYSDVSRFLQNTKTDVKILPTNIYVSFADIGLEIVRYPRQ